MVLRTYLQTDDNTMQAEIALCVPQGQVIKVNLLHLRIPLGRAATAAASGLRRSVLEAHKPLNTDLVGE